MIQGQKMSRLVGASSLGWTRILAFFSSSFKHGAFFHFSLLPTLLTIGGKIFIGNLCFLETKISSSSIFLRGSGGDLRSSRRTESYYFCCSFWNVHDCPGETERRSRPLV